MRKFIHGTLVIMGVSTKFGVAAASLHAIGSVFYSKFWGSLPPFSLLPKILGTVLMMLSAVLWCLEAFFEDLPPGSTSRQAHVKAQWDAWKNNHAPIPTMFWGVASSFLSLFAGSMFLFFHAVSHTQLFWVFSGLNITVGYCWAKSSQPDTAAGLTNIAAATCLVAATCCYIASHVVFQFFPMFAALPLKSVGLILDLVTSGLWLSSYGIAPWEGKTKQPLPSLEPVRHPSHHEPLQHNHIHTYVGNTFTPYQSSLRPSVRSEDIARTRGRRFSNEW